MTVRLLRESDIAEVADLHHRVTGGAARPPELTAAYARWLHEAFFLDPTSAAIEAVGSLVHRDDCGAIDGFLGVSARRMRMGTQTFLAAVSSQFVVDPAARSKLVAFALMRRFLSGPQDLSVADEANEPSSKLWRAFGGVSSHLYGTYWIRPLRPVSCAAAFGAKRTRALALARAITAPVARTIDELILRVPGPQRPTPPAGIRAEPLTEEGFIDLAPRFAGREALLPDHDVASLRWSLSRAPAAGRGASLERSLLRDRDGEPVGFYVATLGAGHQAQVLHLAASERAHEPVIRYLVHRAYRSGALSIGGRVQPPLMRALAGSFAFFHKAGPHVLLHARRPELLAAFDRGVAIFSRLEGEWCMRFVDPRTGGSHGRSRLRHHGHAPLDTSRPGDRPRSRHSLPPASPTAAGA